ncbi:MAG: polysaccharide biosynthesis tyrosine autokinase [Herpetosiphonaceae bacterium]|nr:polysaccharide biosynthesis tyrosine autokinase [Herpetosiphonaceae bacterium]
MLSRSILGDYFAMLRHWAWLLVTIAVIFGTTAYVVSDHQPRVYQASTTILVDEAKANADYQSTLLDERRAQTYAQLLTTEQLLTTVIQKLGLHMTTRQLGSMVAVKVVRDTQLIMLQVRDTDPQRAARLANTLATTLADQTQNTRASRFGISKDSLQQQMSGLDKQIHQTEASLAQAQTNNDKAKQDQLQASLTQYRSIYANLLQNDVQLQLAEAQSSSSISQADPAIADTRPVAPRIAYNALIAAILGVVLAAGSVLLKESLDDSVKNPEALSVALGLPILGLIARIDRTKRSGLIVVEQPRSPVSEAFRVLRTNFQFTGVDRPIRTLLVTSPSQDEGKSTLCANIAAVLAQSGQQVMLVDGDLRRPTQHKLFELTNRSGLSELFKQPLSELENVIRRTSIKGVSLVTAGAIPPNPAELIGSEKMRGILQQLQTQADIVLIDTPPVTPVTDAVVLAQRVDGVVLVVRSDVTKMSACQQAVAQLQHVGANVIGLVINDISPRRARYEYAYRGYYNAYYGSHNKRRLQLPSWLSRKHQQTGTQVQVQPISALRDSPLKGKSSQHQ